MLDPRNLGVLDHPPSRAMTPSLRLQIDQQKSRRSSRRLFD
jgi:hypothetical protein